MNDFAFGGLGLPAPILLLFGSVFAALWLGQHFAQDERGPVERVIWLVIALTLLAARTGFVLRYREIYLEVPLRVLDIRDGGFMPAAGLAAGVAAGSWLAWRQAGRRKALLAALAAGCVVWGVGGAALSMSGQRQSLPDAPLASLDGGTVRLGSMLGKPVVVNLWASWCPPCRREMPVLAAAQRAHPEVAFVFANQGETSAAVTAYLAGEGLRLENVLLDSATTLAQKTGSAGLPTTLFFDAQGKLLDRRMGELSPATLAQRLETLRQTAPVMNK